MPFTPEDLAVLGGFIESKVASLISSRTDAPAAEPVPREALVGVPDVPFDAGPLYYVHLANGEIVQSHDSASTHLADTDGRTQLVIGRYPVGG